MSLYTKDQYLQLRRDIDKLIASKNEEGGERRFLKLTPKSLKRELPEESESKNLARHTIGAILSDLQNTHPCIKKPAGTHEFWIMLSGEEPPAAILPDGSTVSTDAFRKFVNIIHDGFGRNFTDHKCLNVLPQLKQFFTQEAQS